MRFGDVIEPDVLPSTYSCLGFVLLNDWSARDHQLFEVSSIHRRRSLSISSLTLTPHR